MTPAKEKAKEPAKAPEKPKPLTESQRKRIKDFAMFQLPAKNIAEATGATIEQVAEIIAELKEVVEEMKILNQVRAQLVIAIQQGEPKLAAEFIKINDRRWKLLELLSTEDVETLDEFRVLND